MDLARTSRVVPMLIAEIADEQGVKHKVCYTTNEQNCQLITIVSPAPLRVVLDRPSIAFERNGQVTLPVQIRRDKSLSSPVTLELVLPSPHSRCEGGTCPTPKRRDRSRADHSFRREPRSVQQYRSL